MVELLTISRIVHDLRTRPNCLGYTDTLMNDANFQRLVNCFEKVFPNLNPSDIPAATQENVAQWDSVAHLTLLSLTEEEFGIQVDIDAFEAATSFRALLELTDAETHA
jgi:acyl carrier protein